MVYAIIIDEFDVFSVNVVIMTTIFSNGDLDRRVYETLNAPDNVLPFIRTKGQPYI